MTNPAGGRPPGARDWAREPYRESVQSEKGRTQVKLNANVAPDARRQFHLAARAAGVSMSWLLGEIANRLQIDEETGAVTVDGTPITSPHRDQEALVMPA